jgi:protoporphyrinogen oxidase
MPAESPNVVVLGAGVTGLTVAWELSKVYGDKVVLLEKESAVGGLASTFTRKDLSFDTGSHRLHDGYSPEVDRLIRDVCGPDLLRRDRKGLIYLRDRPLAYPPSALDILFAFGLGECLRFSADFLRARLVRLVRPREPDNFEDFTTAKVGRSLYERFYKPYAVKLYGLPPDRVAKEPAVSRVRKFTFPALLRDLARKLGKSRPPSYLYPVNGIGQLAGALQQRFVANGGQLRFVGGVDPLRAWGDREVREVAFTTRAGDREVVETNLVVSTLPLDALHHLVRREADRNGPPAFDLRWRGLRLLYLITPDKVPSEHETFYFPESHIPFGRVSELNKYSPALNRDDERAVLTIEIPCSVDDAVWNMPDEQLAELCLSALQRLGILRQPAAGGVEFFSRKLRNVYPVYDLGWRERFERIYQRLNAIDNLYLIGRTALFLHCNIDHCMLMALKLAQHLTNGHPSKNGWDQTRQEFFDYRVRE